MLLENRPRYCAACLTGLVGLLLSLAPSGCIPRAPAAPTHVPLDTGPAPAPRVPFASHRSSYAQGSILPSASEAERDNATRTFYDAWRDKYFERGCGEARYYVKAKPGTSTVSEAHGYGMMLMALMAGYEPKAKQYFDGLLRFQLDHQSALQPNLMAWHQDEGCQSSQGVNSATDGDLDIAYALLLADKQWGSCGAVDYRRHARAVIEAIRQREVDRSGRYTLLGDWVTANDDQHFDGTRPSDFMTGHFRSFARFTGNSDWQRLADSSYSIIEYLQTQHAPDTGLVPDFAVSVRTREPRPAKAGFLEGHRDGWYAYNACRVPWRIGIDYLVSGDPRAKRVVDRLTRFIVEQTGGDPSRVVAGYRLDGSPVNSYQSMAFTAPFAVAAMSGTEHQAWLDALWAHLASYPMEKYYEDSIRLLTMVVLSHNWWVPDAVPEPCARQPS